MLIRHRTVPGGTDMIHCLQNVAFRPLKILRLEVAEVVHRKDIVDVC